MFLIQIQVAAEQRIYYAVFSSSTPNRDSYRGYDYAFNLPLTALAWERIGFSSIVLIIGSRNVWNNDPAFSLILSCLEARRATVIFISSPSEHQISLSQTARLFSFNMKGFPGKSNDYLITSDSDLWPLRKEHFLPFPNKEIVLVHSDCCGSFTKNNVTYPMYPMSNIGASVSTWRQIMNANHIVANDSESILSYLEEHFGANVRNPELVVGQEKWYMDQRLVSVRLAEWMSLHGNSSVHRVSDYGFSRLDRSNWIANKLEPHTFKFQYDAHLPNQGFLPYQQQKIMPLINLMYGRNSWEAKWCDDYTTEFLQKVKK